MYGAVIATSRRLGVRQAPSSVGSSVAQLGATAIWVVGQGSMLPAGASLQGMSSWVSMLSRRNLFVASLPAPPQAPEGRQVAICFSVPGAQSQVIGVDAQS